MSPDRIEILRSVLEIEQYRTFWEAQSSTRDAQIDFYLSHISCSPNVLRPHVLVYFRANRPITLLVARLERASLNLKFGYKRLPSPILRIIRMVHGGLLGELDELISELLCDSLKKSMKEEEVDATSLHFIDINSPFFKTIYDNTNFMFRGNVLSKETHHFLYLTEINGSFLNHLTKRERSHQRQREKALLKSYNSDVKIVKMHGTEYVQRIIKIADKIMEMSYQRSLGVGFETSTQNDIQMYFEAQKGWLYAYVLYLDGTPRAFWIGSLQNRVFLSEYLAFDQDHGRHSPGMYLLMKSIDELIKAGECEFIDFGIGHADYKSRLGNKHRDEVNFWIFATSLRGLWLSFLSRSISSLSEVVKFMLDKFNLKNKIKYILSGRSKSSISRTID